MGDERRINQLTAKAYSDIGSSDYFVVDNASEAESKKLPASAIKDGINGASTTANTASTNATRALNIARSTSNFPTGDAYSSSSAYKVGDMVIYNNTLYRCKTACSAASWSVNANNFESISLASAITDLNNDLGNTKLKTIEISNVSIADGETKSIDLSSYLPSGTEIKGILSCKLASYSIPYFYKGTTTVSIVTWIGNIGATSFNITANNTSWSGHDLTVVVAYG